MYNSPSLASPDQAQEKIIVYQCGTCKVERKQLQALNPLRVFQDFFSPLLTRFHAGTLQIQIDIKAKQQAKFTMNPTNPDHHHGSPSNPSAIIGFSSSSSSSSSSSTSAGPQSPSRYESQKRRDWNTFNQYLGNHRPPLSLPQCSGAHVLEFLRYLDQFGKTKVHTHMCHFYGHPNPPAPCPCPLRQAWGSLDALIGRLRAAFEENGGRPESNPFGSRAVRFYLREVRELQSKARGVSYEKKKRKKPTGGTSSSQGDPPPPPPAGTAAN